MLERRGGPCECGLVIKAAKAAVPVCRNPFGGWVAHLPVAAGALVVVQTVRAAIDAVQAIDLNPRVAQDDPAAVAEGEWNFGAVAAIPEALVHDHGGQPAVEGSPLGSAPFDAHLPWGRPVPHARPT